MSKKISKKLLVIPAALIVLGSLVVATTQQASAQGFNQSSLVQKLAQKFGLNQSDVQAVFNQDRQDRHTEAEKQYEALLDAAVKAGKLTDAQRQLILAKHQELEAKRQATLANHTDPRSLSAADREAQMTARKAEMDALKTWASQNGIDLKYLFGGKGYFGHGRGGLYPPQP